MLHFCPGHTPQVWKGRIFSLKNAGNPICQDQDSMKHCLKWIVKEFRHILPVFVFFFIAFNLINTLDSFLLKKSGFEPFSILEISIAAALVAKIFLVIDHLPLDRPFRKKPLIYLILWKTALYWMITFVVRLAIRFWPYLLLKTGFFDELREFFAAIDWRFFATVQSWYLMLLLLYVLSRELARVIGYEKLRKIFLGK